MVVKVNHSLVMSSPDDPAYENKPSDWNADHLITGLGGAASLEVGTSAGTVAAGDDFRFVPSQTVKVSKDATTITGKWYASIKDACDYASGVASTSNRILIDVAPGQYTESPFTIPSFSFVKGAGLWGETQIITNDDSANFVTFSSNSGASWFEVTGPLNSGFAALMNSSGGTAKLFFINIKTGYYGVHVSSGRFMAIGVVSESGGTAPTQLFKASGTGSLALSFSHAMVGTFTGKTAFHASDSGRLMMDLTVGRVSGGVGIHAQDSAYVRMIGGTMVSGTTAIEHEGSAVIECIGSQITSGGFTTDLSINGTGGRVTYSGIMDISKVTQGVGAIDPFLNITSVHGDSADGVYIIGDQYIGDLNNTIPLTALIRATRDSGVTMGGEVVIDTGLDVTVPEGDGFVFESGIIKHITWTQQTLTLSASKPQIYIYINSSGTAVQSDVFPDPDVVILLSTASTDGTDILYLAQDFVELPKSREDAFLWQRDVVGPLNKDGGVITEGSTPKTLDITASNYWYNNLFITSASATPATFRYWYRDGGSGWTTVASQTLIDDTNYDDGSGTLAVLSNNNYRRDSVFVSVNVSTTTFHVVYGQQQFNTAALAIQNPNPPDILLETSCRLAGVVIKKGDAALTRIDDDRPRLGQLGTATTPVVDHGSLSGLTDDDHPQYALRSEGVINAVSAGTESLTTGTVSFANSNGISFGLNAGVMTASIAAGGAPGSISAGTTNFGLGEVVFSNSNNVSFGLNGGTVTASASFSGGGGAALSAGTQSVSTGTVNFANSNGITFGMSGSNQITASHNGLTTARASNDAIGLNTALTANGVAWTVNSSGLSLNIPAFLTTAMQSNAVTLSNMRVSAGTTSNLLSAITFSNSNGITFGLNASTMTASHNGLTTARASNDAVGLNTALTANGVAWTVNSGGLSLNVPAFLTTAALSNHSHGNPTLALTNLSGTTASNSAGLTLSLSAAAPGGGGAINVSAGTTSGNLQTIQFNNSNGVSFGLNGSTVTASVAAGGGAAADQRWQQLPMIRFSLSNLTNVTAINNIPFFVPFTMANNLTVSRGNWEMSRSTSGSNLFTVNMGIYTYVNDTQISLLTSFSGNFSNSATASISGIRRFGILASQSFSLAPGGYVFGMQFSAGNTLSMNYSLRGFSGAAQVGAVVEGSDQYNTATSYNIFPFFGRYTTTSAGMPGSVADAAVRGQFSGVSAPLNPWIGLNKD